MGTLVFVCPATDEVVSTGIQMDSETFKSLYIETVRCPHCHQVHQLAGIRAWLTSAEDVELPHTQAA
jgi:hypothetical protein